MTTIRTKEEIVQEYRIHSIQEATLRVISRKGMSSATMQEIAEEAGVAKGTIYLYFRDRDELIEKTFESAMHQLLDQLDQAMDTDAPFDQKLRNVMAAKFAFFTANREFFRLYLSLRMPEGTPAHQRRQKRTCQPQYMSRVRRFAEEIRQAMNRGEIRSLNPERLATFIIEGSTAVILDRLADDGPATDDIDLIVGLVLDGVRKRSET